MIGDVRVVEMTFGGIVSRMKLSLSAWYSSGRVPS
jgi:hypothetical protein